MENLFENYVQKKWNWNWKWIWKNRRAINTKSLHDFSLICDDIKWGCDWMTFVSMSSNSLKTLCPCFNRIVNNTNSNQLIISWDQLEFCPFESVSIIRNIPNPKQEYFDIFCVYDWETYHIMQFWFYCDAKEWSNKILADFKIYGQCRRLQSICNNEFKIYSFVPSLLNWGFGPIDYNKIELNDDEVKILESFWTYYLTRYDFRIDFFVPDRNFVDIPKYKDIRIAKRKHWDVPFENYDPCRDVPKWYLNHDYTWYTVWKRSNKYAYLRFYHKQVDIFRTWEKTLYYDYIKYSGSVWRLEFEFWTRFTTNWEFKFDWEDTFLKWFEKKVFEYLGINEKTWAFSRFYSLNWVPFNEKSQFQKKIAIGQFASLWYKFMKSWINPLAALKAALKLRNKCSDEDIDKMCNEFLNDPKKMDDIFNAFGLSSNPPSISPIK